MNKIHQYYLKGLLSGIIIGMMLSIIIGVMSSSIQWWLG